ncbi:MAG TPA: T9SS type A sorting domain-containing protein [Chitinophagales bacterium]|nr:T9SS type A sorting domain-containing protein [Chitinophagales bacterium]
MLFRKLIYLSGVLFSLNLNAQMDSILYDGLVRTYMVHVPPSFSGSDTLPLVFSLHGLLMNAQSQSDLSEFNPIADRERFIVVYPNGVNNSWNTFGMPYHGGVDDVGFISALIDTIHREYHIDLTRVYSCGMSNGGFMSYRLACELNNRIAAIASVTGSMTDSMVHYCAPSRPFPILHFHGTADPIVNYNGAVNIRSVNDALEYWRQYNNCPAVVETRLPDINQGDNTTVTKLSWGLCDDAAEVIHYKIEGGGHTWPGNTENFFGVGGAINLDIKASEIIWEFFKQYTLPEFQVSVTPVSEKAFIPVYPNPAEDVLTISADEPLKHIQLTDLSGKTMIYLSTENAHSLSLTIESLSPGMYLLICETEKISSVTKILHK